MTGTVGVWEEGNSVMEQSKSWGWDLAHMKEAGSSEKAIPSVVSSTLQPAVSSFTPINPYVLGGSEQTEKTSESKAAAVQQGRRRRRIEPPRASTASKGRTKRPRRVEPSSIRKKANLKNIDITQALTVTKQGLVKSKSPSKVNDDPNSKVGEGAARTIDHAHFVLLHSKISSEMLPSITTGLGSAYQAAFTKSPSHTIVGDGNDLSARMLGSPKIEMVEPQNNDHDLEDDSSSGRYLGIPEDLPIFKDRSEPLDDYIRFMKPGHATTGDNATSSDRIYRSNSLGSIRQGHQSEDISSGGVFVTACEESDLARSYHSSSPLFDKLNGQQHVEAVADGAADLPLGRVQTSCNAPRDSLSRHSPSVYDEDDELFVGIDEFLSDDFTTLATERRLDDTHDEDMTLVIDPYADDDLDAQLMNLDSAPSKYSEGQSPPFTQRTQPGPTLQRMPPTPDTSPERLPQIPSQVRHKGPVHSTTKRPPLSEQSPNLPSHVLPSKDGRPAPFVRPAFPKPLLPRSPIPGTSPTLIRRTCFRIGEALNAASLALRGSKDAIVELYCRVRYSERQANGHKQLFEFADLFTPEKSPSFSGQYAIWKGVGLWEHDSRQFLGHGGRGKKARVVGRIKRGPNNKGWEMTILSIWKVDWEDVGIGKGIVCS